MKLGDLAQVQKYEAELRKYKRMFTYAERGGTCYVIVNGDGSTMSSNEVVDRVELGTEAAMTVLSTFIDSTEKQLAALGVLV